MSKNVSRYLSIKDSTDKYVFEAKDVAKFHSVSLNAVYNSRKVGDKLDKLMAFNKMQEAVDIDDKNTVCISGDKTGVLNGLENILSDDKKYEILYREI